MEELQVIIELVNDLAAITSGKDSPSSPCMWIHCLQIRCATSFTGEFDLQSQAGLIYSLYVTKCTTHDTSVISA